MRDVRQYVFGALFAAAVIALFLGVRMLWAYVITGDVSCAFVECRKVIDK